MDTNTFRNDINVGRYKIQQIQNINEIHIIQDFFLNLQQIYSTEEQQAEIQLYLSILNSLLLRYELYYADEEFQLNLRKQSINLKNLKLYEELLIHINESITTTSMKGMDLNVMNMELQCCNNMAYCLYKLDFKERSFELIKKTKEKFQDYLEANELGSHNSMELLNYFQQVIVSLNKSKSSHHINQLKTSNSKITLCEESFIIKNFYSYDILKGIGPYPSDVIPSKREQYLDEVEFQSIFGMNKESFARIPKWKQIQLKKNLLLF